MDVGRKDEEEESEDFDRSKLEVNDEEQESESGGASFSLAATTTTDSFPMATPSPDRRGGLEVLGFGNLPDMVVQTVDLRE
ncbi:hypothetical protein Tco_1087579, partial [Tanacetum coccineum]